MHKLKKKDVKKYNYKIFIDQKYVNYPRNDMNNLYNEIYDYLKYDIIPESLKS